MLAPEVESLPWEEQLALDDAAYRGQLVYLFERSGLLPRQAGRGGVRVGGAAGGLAEIGALPLTEKARAARRRHARTTRSARTSARRRRDRPHLLDQRHHRHAELHPADRGRPRQLGDRLGAQLRGIGHRGRRADRLHLQRRAVRGRRGAGARSTASASATSRSAPATPSGWCWRSSCCGRGGGADALVRRAPDRVGGRAAASTSPSSSVERVLVAGEPGGGEPAFRRACSSRAGARA